MRLRDALRPDIRRAINATPARRTASVGSMLLLVALAVAFGSVTPWWVWPLLVVLEGIVFVMLGIRWAGNDALAREGQE